MNNPIVQPIELTGTSTASIEDAVNQALVHAHLSTKQPGWFQVTDTRGRVDEGKITHWHVIIRVGSDLEIFDKECFTARHFGAELPHKEW